MATDRPDILVAQALGEDRYRFPNVGDPEARDVVFGGQLMAQMMVLATDRNPGKEVKTIHTIFARAARVGVDTQIEAESMHAGRAFASETLTVWQEGRLCARAMVLLSADEPDVIRQSIAVPPTPGPEAGEPSGPAGLLFPGADFSVVGGADLWSVDAPVGPAELNVWMRYRPAPAELAVAQAIVAYGTDGFLIGAAMRPFSGMGQDRAHVDLSTGVISHTMTFHEPFDIGQWVLVAQEVVYTGRGRNYGRGNVFTEGGASVASFVQDSMIRSFAPDVKAEGQHRTIM